MKMTSFKHALTIRNENEMIIIDSNNDNYNDGLIVDESINVDNPTCDVIDVEQYDSFLCCPLEFINWNEPHGLLYYNLPWFPKRTSARDWFIDNRNSIRIPDEHKIIPSTLTNYVDKM